MAERKKAAPKAGAAKATGTKGAAKAAGKEKDGTAKARTGRAAGKRQETGKAGKTAPKAASKETAAKRAAASTKGPEKKAAGKAAARGGAARPASKPTAKAARKAAKAPTADPESRIIDADYAEHMEKSYLDYAMSVIVSRALPDVRDGLKPVQRRILYDMKTLGTTSDKPYRKSARIVGDAMGKFHPHGDSSIYGALVVLAQDFKMGVPLVDGHGNFGSIEGDGAAASRYTEARLTAVAEDLFLQDLDKGVVDFVPNYDETETEPEVLPAKAPNFVVNGAEGIAVGMATNVPPHNLAEVLEAEIALIRNPKLPTNKLMETCPGPDFPTGGVVANRADLKSIFETGTGKLRLRGKASFEDGEGGRRKIVVTEIPYTMVGSGIERFLLDVVDLAESRTLEGVVDVSNQSSKDGIRLVIEFRKGADLKNALNVLYRKTKLEDTFGVNALAIVDGKPETLGFREALLAHADFLFATETRKRTTLLAQAEKRREIQEGLIKACDCVDLIVEILRGSKTRAQAKACMVEGKTAGVSFKTKKSETAAKRLLFTDAQADAVLDMRLHRLIGLEIDALKADLAKTEKEIATNRKALDDPAYMRKLVTRDLAELAKRHGRPRRTALRDEKEAVVKAAKPKDEPCVVLVDRFGYAHAIDAGTYARNREAADASYRFAVPATTEGKVAFLTDDGESHLLPTRSIPYGKMRDKGSPLDNLCGYDGTRQALVGAFSTAAGEIVFATANGLAKVVDSKLFDVSRRASKGTKLSAGDSLLAAFPAAGVEGLLFVTGKGLGLKVKLSALTRQKKDALGAKAVDVYDGDPVRAVGKVAAGADSAVAGGARYDVGAMRWSAAARRPKAVEPVPETGAVPAE